MSQPAHRSLLSLAWRLGLHVLIAVAAWRGHGNLLAAEPDAAAASGAIRPPLRPAPGQDWAYLQPGDYHAGEAPIDAGEGWLTLVAVAGRWQLLPVPPQVARIADDLLDAGEQRTGIRLASSLPDADDARHVQQLSLRWAGDLDGDGQLDLIVAYEAYNRAGSCVLLSTLAAPGELVGRLACHGGVGC